MQHEIIKDTYRIYSDEGETLLTIQLTNEPEDQITISTDSEVYAGPIKFIKFNEV